MTIPGKRQRGTTTTVATYSRVQLAPPFRFTVGAPKMQEETLADPPARARAALDRSAAPAAPA